MYKSVIKGGGKFNKEYKRTYLSHCENLFNESSEEVKQESRNYLLAELEKDVRKAIINEYADAESKTRLQESVDIIFGSENKTAINLDTNHLGVVNVVSLQCVVLFTYAANNFLEPEENNFIVHKEHLDNLFSPIRNRIQYSKLVNNRDKDWRYYENIDKTLLFIANNFYGKEYNSNWQEPFSIITIIDFFTIDEIFEQYLKFDKYYTGLLYKLEFVDGEKISPIDFILHDMEHYLDFYRGCRGKTDYIINLYEFINTATQISQRNAAKLILYLHVHESNCFISNVVPDNIEALKLDLLNDDDLGKLIPQKYRYSMDTRFQYLKYALETYREALERLENFEEVFVPTTKPPPLPKSIIYTTHGNNSDDDFDPDIVDEPKESSGGKKTKTKKRKSKKTKRKGKKRTKSTNKKLI
jgi:hypothetical protein